MGVKHGGRYRTEYMIWIGMKCRCFTATDDRFRDYGGRGITVCEEWRRDFAAFLRDVGPRPSPKHSIDRIDPDGNYEPGNVRWATASEQQQNKRPPRESLAVKAKVGLTVKEISNLTGLKPKSVYQRFRAGYSAEQIVQPKHQGNNATFTAKNPVRRYQVGGRLMSVTEMSKAAGMAPGE